MEKLSVEEIEKIISGQVCLITSKKLSEIDPQKPLHTFGIDSLGFVELLVFIEKRFELKLMESGLTKENFKTIRALAGCINKLS